VRADLALTGCRESISGGTSAGVATRFDRSRGAEPDQDWWPAARDVGPCRTGSRPRRGSP